jgi:aminoglycoside phosphotransferase (APT) family kinase protein
MMTTTDKRAAALPGLDLPSFRTWFEQACPGQVSGPLTGSLIAGGRSNLTYEITDGSRHWIIRRPPLGHVLETAHDMSREYRVMHALRSTAVPVPVTYANCVNPDVIGAPFYVMQRVPGIPYRDASELMALGAARTAQIGREMVDILARLHAIDAYEVGLGDLGRPGGFLERQVRLWTRQLEASRSRDLPEAARLSDLLARRIPAQATTAIIHGDFRLDNLLVDHDSVQAVIDWEMATLGDPLTDVALLVAYGELAELAPEAALVDVNLAPGYPGGDQIIAMYAAASGRDVHDMDFYLGLAYFKLAAILEGIHYRYVQGQTVGDGFDVVGTAVTPLLNAGIRALSQENKEQ